MTDSVATASQHSIQRGSTSFAAAARLFDPRIREDAYMLYAWCRHCDDEIDGQVMGHGAIGIDPVRAGLKLVELEEKTRRAIAGEPMTDTAFIAFQRVVQRHDIPGQHPLDLLRGFRMDVEGRTYRTLQETLTYAYHVAGVVGVMMAHVMGVRDIATLHRASDLGIALQLTNIARDVIEDAKGGRVYLPADWLGAIGNPAAVLDSANRATVFAATTRLLAEAEPYYASARWGLRALAFRSAWAVAAAQGIYRQIGLRVLAGGPAGMDRRASTDPWTKLARALHGGFIAGRASTMDRWRHEPDRAALWTPF